MKLRVLNIICCLFIAACGITSCLHSDEIEYEFSSNASITAFAIKDSIITRYPAVVNGKDTTLSKGIVGTDYPFVIDQSTGLIYNPDSLPVGTDVSKVVLDITADSYAIYIVAETDSLWEEKDSLNFNNPIQFKVLAEIGTFGRTYTAKINVHQQDPEIMGWQKLNCNFDTDIKEQKAVYLNNTIYVFGKQGEQTVITKTQATDGKDWTAPVHIDTPAEADITSAMAWGNQLYLLAGNELYTSQDGLSWEKVGTTKLQQLIANVYSDENQKIMAIDTDNHYTESQDGINWVSYEEMPDRFPTSRLSFTSYPLDTNKDIYRTVVVGDHGVASDSTTVAWTQLDTDTDWTDLEAQDNANACPKLENMTMVRYNNELYMFGGKGQRKGAIAPFSKIFTSKDNGITWQTTSKNVVFPEEFQTKYEESDGYYSSVVDENHFIWIMWSKTGEVWRGRINKLGFDK